MVDRLIRGTAALIAVVGAVGAGAFYYLYSPGGVEKAQDQFARYAALVGGRSPVIVPLCWLAAALALAAAAVWIAGKVMATHGSRRASSRTGSEPANVPTSQAERARIQLSLFEKIRHRVEHLVFPEPGLEEAFAAYYQDPAESRR